MHKSLHLQLVVQMDFCCSNFCHLFPTTPTKKCNRFGGAWKTWNATVICSCTPPAPPHTDRRQGSISPRWCCLLSVSFFTSAAASPLLVENNQDRSFLLCFHWSCCGDERCCLTAFSLILIFWNAKHEAVEQELFLKTIFTLVICVLHVFIYVIFYVIMIICVFRGLINAYKQRKKSPLL